MISIKQLFKNTLLIVFVSLPVYFNTSLCATFLSCNSGFIFGQNTTPRCSSWVLVDESIVISQSFDTSQLDPNVLGSAFAAGFMIFLIPWGTAYGFSSLTNFIKKW